MSKEPWLASLDFMVLHCVSLQIRMATDLVVEYANVDFCPLLNWSGGLRTQDSIQHSRDAMISSPFLHAGTSPRNLIRAKAGVITGEYRDPARLMENLSMRTNPSDRDAIQRVNKFGCPNSLQQHRKMQLVRRGNQK